MKLSRLTAAFVACGMLAAEQSAFGASDSTNSERVDGWITNAAAVYAVTLPVDVSNSPASLRSSTNRAFRHFLPGSLNHLVWTNFIAHTNGKEMRIWSVRSHPLGWPLQAPVAAWNTNSLLWGMKGFTGLSPCWQVESAPGQVPVTALTRRHGYTRGHGMGVDGFNTGFAGQKVWFLTADNTVIQVTVVRDVVRTWAGGKDDYTILLFNRDLPLGIEPLRVVAATNMVLKYPQRPGAPHVIFKTEQLGQVSAEVPGFQVNTWKGGDSGSPNLLPMPNELVFHGGRSTSEPSPQMQSDMDELCRLERLDPKKYQLNWLDLSDYPFYSY